MFLSHWVSLPFILTPKGTSDKSRRDFTFGAMTKDVAPVPPEGYLQHGCRI